jgi:hypothetical protein
MKWLIPILIAAAGCMCEQQTVEFKVGDCITRKETAGLVRGIYIAQIVEIGETMYIERRWDWSTSKWSEPEAPQYKWLLRERMVKIDCPQERRSEFIPSVESTMIAGSN